MEFFVSHSVAESTRRSYSSAQRRYLQFCRDQNLSPVPTSEGQLCQFVSYLALANLSHNTMKCYLSAIRHWHIAEGAGDPQISKMPRLEQVLRGIKLTHARGEKEGNVRLPVSIDVLEKMREVWQTSASRDSEMLWAAASLCFFGFLRSGELTVEGFDEGAHLSFRDITVDSLENPQILQVRLKASKTDPFRAGVEVFVGRTGCKLCPVEAVLSYMTKRGQASGPLFIFQDGKPLTRSRFVTEVKKAFDISRGGQHRLLRSQLQEWSGNDGSETRAGGGSDQNAGSLAQQCVPIVYQDPSGTTCSSFKGPLCRGAPIACNRHWPMLIVQSC